MEDWKLTEAEWAKLTDEQKSIYRIALSCMAAEHAGGLFGWSRGHELLKSLGWTEVRQREGHRYFVSLKKPQP